MAASSARLFPTRGELKGARKPWLRIVAVRRLAWRSVAALVAAASLLYGALWMYYVRSQTASAELGLVAEYVPAERAAVVRVVENGSPAARAGLRPADAI